MKTYIIYEINCNNKEIIEKYIGSTTNFRSRKAQHKRMCNDINSNFYYLKIYMIIRENGGWDNWKMVPIEQIECETIIASRIREQYWIKEYNSKLNTYKAHKTEEEHKQYNIKYKQKWYIDNIEKIKIANKQKYIDNKETKKAKSRAYYDKNSTKNKELYTCECGKELAIHSKFLHNKSKTHLDFVAGIERKIINTIACACGGKYTKCGISHHNKTKIHIQYLSTINI